MTWIPIIPRAEADQALGAAYDAAAGARGTVANIIGVHSVHPEAMTAHLRLYQELMFAPSELTRAEREAVAVAVSRANDCFY
jgi:alkylhydroperoxidase family enzyme